MRPSDYLKRGWCQGAEARNAAGEDVDEFIGDPVSWCPIGATFAAYPGMDGYATREALFGAIDRMLKDDEVSNWNDDPDRTQEEVVAFMLEVEKGVLDEQGTS